MVRYTNYFLKLLCPALLLCSCQTDNKELLVSLSEERKAELTEKFAQIVNQTYQGSTHRQEALDSLMVLQPEKASYYREKSVTLTKIGDYHQAFPLLEKAAKRDTEILFYSSWVLLRLYRDYERALQQFETIDAMTPNQPDYAGGQNVNYSKGLAHKQLGNYEKAIAEFTICITDEGEANTDPYVFVYRGISHTNLKQYEQALQDFDLALKYYPQSSMACYYKAEALLAAGKPEAAKAYFQKAQHLIQQGYTRGEPYREVIDQVHAEMIEDQLLKLKTI